MAIISCPNCGKQITDRMEKCPHCDAILLKPKEASSITKDEIKQVIKDNIICVLLATVLTIVVFLIWCNLAVSLASPMGDLAVVSVVYAKNVFFSSTFVLLIIEAVLLCISPILLKKKATLQIVISIASTVLFGIIGFVVQHHATLQHSKITAEVMAYSLSLSLGFGTVFPMLLGSLSLSRHESALKKSVAIQIGLSAIFFVLSAVLGYLMVNLFAMGTNSLSIGNLISVVAVLVLATLTNKSFQQLITPNKLV